MLVTALLVTLLWRWQRNGADTKRFALIGIFAALMIVVMSIEIPPYHVNLSVVTGIVLGPALAVVASLIVNLFLAFVGHGGITVVGLNTLVIAVEMLAGYGIFRLLTRVRLKLAPAAFIAVVLGLALGTATSFGIVTLGAPAIDTAMVTRTHEHIPGILQRLEGQARQRARDTIDTASSGGRLNLGYLAWLMFGVGSIGWVLEGVLSTAILVSLNRVYPNLVIREECGDGYRMNWITSPSPGKAGYTGYPPA